MGNNNNPHNPPTIPTKFTGNLLPKTVVKVVEVVEGFQGIGRRLLT
jgi:hypothetical protein